MSDDSYYRILEFLDNKLEDKEINDDDLTSFKKQIRDNKYVSTYIRSLKLKIDDFKTSDDFIKAMDKHTLSKKFEDVVYYEIRQALDSIWSVKNGIDPIQVMKYVIDSAMEREGKICDFRDSINPNKIIGKCQNDEHLEVIDENVREYLTDEEQKEFDKIVKDEGWNEAVYRFEDKFFPEEELELTLGQDVDIHKFDDSDTYYICKKCMVWIRDNGESEVSCDME